MNDNGEERTEIIVLVDEEGNEHEFAMIDRFQVDLYDYAILIPVLYGEDEDDEGFIDIEDDAYIFRIEAGVDEESMIEVEDEEEWNNVAAQWEERLRTMGDNEFVAFDNLFGNFLEKGTGSEDDDPDDENLS